MRSNKQRKVMRLTRGSKVEVFCTTKSIPHGFWRQAQIVCGNGRTYMVQYDSVPSSPQNITHVEKVMRKAIRPCPPVRDKPIKWVPGDVVEVFVHGAWKVGKITGIAYGNNFYFVTMSGHVREIAVRVCNLRRMQIWENKKWLLVKKGSDMERSRISKELQRVHNKVMHGQSESIVSSTGSCDTSGRPYQNVVFTRCDDDAESTIASTKYISIYDKRRSAKNKPELEEYLSTLAALHANGPISWKMEALLADLRISLNISIDQHTSILMSLAPPKLIA